MKSTPSPFEMKKMLVEKCDGERKDSHRVIDREKYLDQSLELGRDCFWYLVPAGYCCGIGVWQG